jgi:hypothetical protein
MNTLTIYFVGFMCQKKPRAGNNILNMYTNIVKTYTYIADEV